MKICSFNLVKYECKLLLLCRVAAHFFPGRSRKNTKNSNVIFFQLYFSFFIFDNVIIQPQDFEVIYKFFSSFHFNVFFIVLGKPFILRFLEYIYISFSFKSFSHGKKMNISKYRNVTQNKHWTQALIEFSILFHIQNKKYIKCE